MFAVYIGLVTFALLVVTAAECPSSQCTCDKKNDTYYESIICTNRVVSSIEALLHPVHGSNCKTNRITIGTLNLTSNRVSNIEANDFCGVRPLKLDLSNNNISSIHDRAFDNLESTTELYIRNNQLASLPNASLSLHAIQSLDVRDNEYNDRAVTLSDNVMKAMGDTLQKFYFGSKDLLEWPRSLHHLQGLQELTLDKAAGHLKIIPPTSFNSFRSTLKKLTIRNTQLKAVPLGVSTLRRISEFYFDHNVKVGDGGIIIQALFQSTGPTITKLSLVDDSLTKFPDALKYIKSLKSLTMSRNNLQYISDESVVGLNITELVLKHCSLERIPGVLQDLTMLNNLDLSHNNIINVERSDILIMPHLKTIDLSFNPLKFISTNSFKNNTELITVKLVNTNMTEIPLALNESSIRTVDLSDNNIECMCEYVWLSSKRNLNIDGRCGNIIQTISDYITNFIPSCPAYIAEH